MYRRRTGLAVIRETGLALLLVTGRAAAQPVILYGPVIDSVTYSSARITWVTDVPATTVIHFGLTSAYGATNTGVEAETHSWYLSGLAPATTYHFRVCSRAGGGERCSPDQVLTTAKAPPVIPAPPEPPRQYVDTSLPAGDYGEPFRVDANCSNLPAILDSLARLEGELNYEIQIAPRTVCSGQFIFPARPKHRGWIVVKSTEEARLPFSPPELAYTTSNMPVFRTDALPGLYVLLLFAPTNCSPGALAWGYGTPGMGLIVCAPQGDSGGAKPITNATGSVSGPGVITVPAHGYKPGNIVRIDGTGLPVDGLAWRITVIDENSFSLDGSRGGRPYSGAGTATRDDSWTQAPHTAGTELPSTCTPNEWFFKNDVTPETQAAFWCTASNQWTNVRVINTGDLRLYAAIQLAEDASRYRFIGLEITHIPTPNPPPPGWEKFNYRQGSFGSLVATRPSSKHIIFDRCDIHGLDYPSRVWFGLFLDGEHVALIHSRVHKINQWTERADGINQEALGIYIPRGPGPGKIENNFLEAIGITLFFPDDYAHVPPPADYEIRKNHFSHPDKYLYGSPLNTSGKNYMNRHLVELKTGQRMVVEGNLFDGNWADVNQGAMITLSPRASTYAAVKTITSIENGTVRVDPAQDPYPRGMLVRISNTGAANHDGLWEIEEVVNPTTFKLKNPPMGKGERGRIQALSSNTQVSDIDIRNNVFQKAPELMWVVGHNDSKGNPQALTTKTTQRIRFANNLVTYMDARPTDAGGRCSPIGIYWGGRVGLAFYFLLGMEDLIIRNNTFADFRGNQPVFLVFGGTTAGAHAGLEVRDNIFTANPLLISRIDGGGIGVEALDQQWTQYPRPWWTVTRNVFCCHLTAPMEARKPPGNLYVDSEEQVGFDSNFALQPTSRFKGMLAGRDPGFNYDELYGALPEWLWFQVAPYTPSSLRAGRGAPAPPRRSR